MDYGNVFVKAVGYAAGALLSKEKKGIEDFEKEYDAYIRLDAKIASDKGEHESDSKRVVFDQRVAEKAREIVEEELPELLTLRMENEIGWQIALLFDMGLIFLADAFLLWGFQVPCGVICKVVFGLAGAVFVLLSILSGARLFKSLKSGIVLTREMKISERCTRVAYPPITGTIFKTIDFFEGKTKALIVSLIFLLLPVAAYAVLSVFIGFSGEVFVIAVVLASLLSLLAFGHVFRYRTTIEVIPDELQYCEFIPLDDSVDCEQVKSAVSSISLKMRAKRRRVVDSASGTFRGYVTEGQITINGAVRNCWVVRYEDALHCGRGGGDDVLVGVAKKEDIVSDALKYGKECGFALFVSNDD